jgi:hypothetical protein
MTPRLIPPFTTTFGAQGSANWLPSSFWNSGNAWMKRYFGLKYFQGFTLLRVTQFVLLTYSAALAVALAAHRYQRPDFYRRRSMILAHV